ncbi:hypothetical protein SD71_15270 [Cohnella kolymensis]|uniref:Copper amine oxidase-like N-terminal domain-containing protein n=1 Tax=Cohnella kolymensis TaxID=1590652 RepID=A0ABR5A212_9BACL|nr:hypothetical protein [Cohnella kolymensis]KIL35030.1 hypothetical protein SD71_15270 [Cohnella kolymensis]
MKDKVKGIVLGLAVGSLVFGSVGFAAGSQISVKVQKAAVYFDGVKKSLPSGQETFIYKGQVYAPASFVAG